MILCARCRVRTPIYGIAFPDASYEHICGTCIETPELQRLEAGKRKEEG